MIHEIKFIETTKLNQNKFKFDRLYYGNDLSDVFLPTIKQLEYVTKKIKKVTLVTPVITQSKLEDAKMLLNFLNKIGEFEVVVNDFGMLRLISKKYNNLIPIIGRVLIKQKTDPRHYYESYQNKESSEHTLLSDPFLCNFLKKNGVKRVEINNSLQKIYLPDGFSYSLYYPDVLVALKRDYKNKQEYILQHDDMKRKMYSNGCAFFYKNKKIDQEVKTKIDRIIHT